MPLLILTVLLLLLCCMRSAFAGQLLFDGVPVDITTSDDEDMIIAPGGVGITQIGDGSGTRDIANGHDDLYVTGNIEVEGATRFEGTMEVHGLVSLLKSVTIGGDSNDTLTINGTFASHLVPSPTSTYDLGSITKSWRMLYADGISSITGKDLSLTPVAGKGLTASVTRNAATGNEVLYDLSGTVSKATSGNYTGLKLNVTQTAAPGTDNKLLDLAADATSRFSVDAIGAMTVAGSALAPAVSSTGSGRIYFDSATNKFKASENGGAYADLGGGLGGGGDVTRVGSMTTGDVFYDATADDDWLGLGAAAGRMEFDDQATDEVNILDAKVGIGTSTPGSLLHLLGSSPNLRLENSGGADTGKLSFYDNVPAEQGYMQWSGGTGDLTIGNNSADLVLLPTGNVGIGTATPGASLDVLDTTEQLRLSYDASNYLSTTAGATGSVTLNATGAGAGFIFSDAITASAGLGCTDCIALTSETSGNYVTSVATTAPLSGGAAGSEGAALTLSITGDGIGPTQIDETANYAWTGTHNFAGGMVRMPSSVTLPATCSVGDMYMDTDATSGMRFYLCESANVWNVQGDGTATGDITSVGSMVSGLAFGDASADDDWLGLGVAAGRIEFDDQATDEVNIMGANVGIGTQTPSATLDVVGTLDFSDVTGDVSLFNNEVIADVSDGNSIYIRRNAATETDRYLRLLVDNNSNPRITSDASLFIQPNTSIEFERNININQYTTVANYTFRHYGYITELTDQRYIQWLVSDTTNNFELSREDTNIGFFDVKMPTIFSTAPTAASSGNIVAMQASLGIMDGSDTVRGLFVDLANADHTGAGNILYGLDIDGITQDAEATETALHIGSGWDNAAIMAGTVQIGEAGTDGVLKLYSEEGATDQSVTFQPNADMTQDTVYTLPADDGANGQALITDGNGALSWSSVGAGDITAVTAGDGLAGGAVSGNATLDIAAGDTSLTVNANDLQVRLKSVAQDGLATSSSVSGLEVATGVTLLQGCGDSQILKWNEAADTWGCANDAGTGSGAPIVLDLGDDSADESASMTEVATLGDTNSIFSEPASDKLLINLGNDWPKADTADDLTCTNCIGATEITDLALGTDTSGNYVASIATTSPLSGGAAGSEGGALTLSISADGLGPTQIDETANYAWTGTHNFAGGVLRVPSSTTLPATCATGDSYMDTDATSGARYYLCESANVWTQQGGVGDITGVGSMGAGLAFGDATADDDWLGLGVAAGRIEFDDQTTDEVNILSANVGIGDATPDGLLDVEATGAVTAASYGLNLSNLETNGTTDGINKYGTYVTSTGNFVGSGGAATNNYGLYIDTVSGGDNNYGAVIKQPIQLGDGTDGQLILYSEQGATDYSVTFNPHATMTQNVVYTLPADDGAASQSLTTDGNGALSWSTVGTGDVTDVNPGFAIDVTNSTGPNPTVDFDPTEFISNRTWGDGSDASMAWTYNLSGTDPVLTFGSGLLTVSHDLTVNGGDFLFRDGTNTLWTFGDGGEYGTQSTAIGASGGSVDVLGINAGNGSGDTSGDLIQLTMDGANVDGFSGNAIHVVTDISQSTGNAILFEDDAAHTIFSVAESGWLTIGDEFSNATSIGPAAGDNFLITDMNTFVVRPGNSGNTDILYVNNKPAAGASGSILGSTATINAMDGSDAVRGFYLNLTNANHTGASNTLYGMDIAGITADAEATEVGLRVGAGWDRAAEFHGNVHFGNIAGGTAGRLIIYDADGSSPESVQLDMPNLTTSYTLTFPLDDGAVDQVLRTDGSGVMSWVTASSLPGVGDITDVNEGLAIDVTNGTGPNPTIDFDPTELLGNRTWGDGSDASITWTYGVTGTDPSIVFSSALATMTYDLAVSGGDLTVNGATASNGLLLNTANTDSVSLRITDTAGAGAADATIAVSDGDLVLSPSGGVGIFDSTPDAVFDVDATSLTTGSGINFTVTNTATTNTAIQQAQFNLTNAQATAANTNFVGLSVNFTNNPTIAGNTERVVRIQNEVTTNTTDNAVGALLTIDNADTSATGSTTISNAIHITNTGGIASGIIDAVDASDTTIDNALNAGPNVVLFSDGGYLNMSGVDPSSTTEGMRVPQGASCAASTGEGQLCWDTDNDTLYLGTNGSALAITSGTGDVTAVGSMASGDVFADATADNQWLGLGATAGRVAFDDQPTDYVNILDANVGIGTVSPNSRLEVAGNISITDPNQLVFGTSGAEDTNLYRSAVDTLKTDDALVVGSNLTVAAGAPAAGGSGNLLASALTLNAMNGSDAVRGLYLNLTNADHSGAGNILYGVDVAGITADAQASEFGLHIGSGWDGAALLEGSVQTGADGTDGQLVVYSEQGATDYSVTFNPHAAMTQSVTYTLPADDGAAGQVLQTNGTGALIWVTGSSLSGVGDITAVGSMASGDAFADATADDDWIGLGSAAGNIEFDDQTTDEVNILNANVGIGTQTPGATLDVRGSAVFNELGADNDFRIEGDTDANLFALDAGNDSIGIGAAGQPNKKLYIGQTTAVDSDNSGEQIYIIQNTARAHTLRGLELTSEFSGTSGSQTGINGLDFIVKATGNGGTVATMKGISAWANVSTGATVTDLRLTHMVNPSNAGTIGTLYGLYIDAMTTGGINYAIYSAGGNSIHAGNWQVGMNGTDGILKIYSEQGGTDYTTTFQPPAAMTQNVVYTLPADDGGASQYLMSDGSGNLSWSTPTGAGDLTDVLEGLAIDVTNGAGPNPTVAFDPTELLGSRTWGDASTDTIVWTFDRLTGTDPTITFGNGLLTTNGDLTVSGGDVTISGATASNGLTQTTANSDSVTLRIVDTASAAVAHATLATTDGNLILSPSTNIVSSVASINPSVTRTYDLGTTSLRWNAANFGGTINFLDGSNNGGTIGPVAGGLKISATASGVPGIVFDPGSGTFDTWLDDVPAAGSGGDLLGLYPTLAAMNGSDTIKGLSIAITNANHTGTSNTLYGIDIGGVTADAEATEVGIHVTSGWDTAGIFAGALQTGEAGTDGQLVLYSEQGATDYSVTFNPHAAMTQNVVYTLPADDGGASQFLQTDGSGALVWATPTGSGDLTDVLEGLAIDVTNGAGPNPTVAFDPTELNGSRAWGDASTNTIVWTFDRQTGTDPALTFEDNGISTSNHIGIGASSVAGSLLYVYGNINNDIQAEIKNANSGGTAVLQMDNDISSGEFSLGGSALSNIYANRMYIWADTGTAGSAIVAAGGGDDIRFYTGGEAVTNERFRIADLPAAGASGPVLLTAYTLNAMDGSDTVRGAFIDIANADHTGASNSLYGLDIDAITGDAEATEYGIHVGTGWDYSAKFDGAVEVDGQFGSPVYTIANCSGGAATINWNNGNIQHIILTQACTLTFSGGTTGRKYTLIVKQDGTGGRSITWPGTVRFSGSRTPTLSTAANMSDYLGFIYNPVDSKYDLVAERYHYQ